MDCDTVNKDVIVHLTTDPSSPQAGKEAIAFRFVLDLKALGTTVLSDLANAKLVKNPALTNLVVAENKTEQTANSIRITVAGGFTEQNGVRDEDLFSLLNTDQKIFELSVASGELYEENSLQNFFTDPTASKRTIDSKTECAAQQIPVSDDQNSTDQAPNDANSGSVANDSTPTATVQTTVQIISNKSDNTFKPGDSVVVTATTNGIGQGSWTQTNGSQISPTTSDQQLTSTQRESKLSFTVPTGITTDETISLSYTIDSVTQSINMLIKPEQGELKAAADTNSDLEQRLADLKAEQAAAQIIQDQATTAAGNVHGSAGSLADSGPNEVLALIVISIAVLYGYKRVSQKLQF